MTECWRDELRRHDVRVILCNPSEVLTDFSRRAGGNQEPSPEEARPRGHRPRGARGARDRSAGLRTGVQRVRDESLLRSTARGDTAAGVVTVWRSEGRVRGPAPFTRPSRRRPCTCSNAARSSPRSSSLPPPTPRTIMRAAPRRLRPRIGRARPPARASALLSNVTGGGTDAVPGLGGVTFRPGAGTPTSTASTPTLRGTGSSRPSPTCRPIGTSASSCPGRSSRAKGWWPPGSRSAGLLRHARPALRGQLERRVRLRDQLLGDRRRRLDRDPPRGASGGTRLAKGVRSRASPVRPWTMPSIPVSCSTTGAPATRRTGSTGSVRCRSTTCSCSGIAC